MCFSCLSVMVVLLDFLGCQQPTVSSLFMCFSAMSHRVSHEKRRFGIDMKLEKKKKETMPGA